MKRMIGLIGILCLCVSCATMPNMRVDAGKGEDKKKSTKEDKDLLVLDALTKQVYGKMKLSQFELLQISAQEHAQLLTAEKEGRIDVVVDLNAYPELKDNEKYVNIMWKGKDKKVFKTIKLKMSVTLDKNKNPWFWIKEGYKTFAGYAFPVTTLTTIILIVLMIILL